jgi:hypothetical protein
VTQEELNKLLDEECDQHDRDILEKVITGFNRGRQVLVNPDDEVTQSAMPGAIGQALGMEADAVRARLYTLRELGLVRNAGGSWMWAAPCPVSYFFTHRTAVNFA